MSGTERILTAAAVLLFAGIFGLLLTIYQEKPVQDGLHSPKVAFMLHGGADEVGWNRQLYLGLRQAADTVGVKLETAENVTLDSEKAEQVMRYLRAEGHDFIIASTSDFAEAAHNLQEDGSHTAFALPKLEERGDNCIPYFLRLYQGEYLAGLLAGLRTKSGKIGYVTPGPNPEICRCVNAFALGARETRPDALVLAAFVSNWSAPEEEREAAAKLREAGADILNSQQDGQAVQAYAEEHGLEYVSFMETYAPEGAAGGIVTIFCRWQVVYEALLSDYLRGRLRKSYWLGVEAGAVTVGDFSPRVSEQERQRILQAEKMLQSNFSIFSGDIRDSHGNLRCRNGESLSDEALINMDWYVEGVSFYEDSATAH